MRLLVIGIVILAGVADTLHARIREFPYEAIIDAADTEVRSGPGRKYYATSKLSRGSRVTVHRHDPGGWYMISPPADSFSLIRAEYVERHPGNRGVLNSANVSVRVGSNLDDSRDVWQRRLSTGDEVEIIEEITQQTPQGPAAILKIKPPQGEYRWVSGQFLTPASDIARRQNDRDPFSVPSHVKQSRQGTASTGSGKKVADARQSRTKATNAAKSDPKKTSNAGTESERLEELDIEFRRIVRAATSQWNFAELEQGYRQLQEETADPAVAGRLEKRFAALRRYQQIKGEYDDFMRVVSETSRRDAELLALSRQAPQPFQQPQVVTPESNADPAPTPLQAQGPDFPQGPEFPPMHVGPPAQTSPPVQAGPPIQAGLPVSPQTQVSRRPAQHFDGAGIVQRAATTFPGAPRHVLLTPQGRILAYLQGVPGVNLDRFVGQPMGLAGRRWFRRDLQSDFMIVQSMTPVHLEP